MISRKRGSERRSGDGLDGLIRWSLQESVAGGSPSPETWERIRFRAERLAVWRRLGITFEGGYRATTAQLSRARGFFLALLVSWIWPRGRWGDWNADPYSSRMAFDQYGFFTLLRWAF